MEDSGEGKKNGERHCKRVSERDSENISINHIQKNVETPGLDATPEKKKESLSEKAE